MSGGKNRWSRAHGVWWWENPNHYRAVKTGGVGEVQTIIERQQPGVLYVILTLQKKPI